MKHEKPTPQNEKAANKGQKTQKTPHKAPNIEAPSDEKGGFKDAGLAEPTRYNDWEVNGRCSDF